MLAAVMSVVAIGPFQFKPSALEALAREAEQVAARAEPGRDRSTSARKALVSSGKRSTSTHRGVNLHARSNKWETHIWDGHQVHVGCFDTELQAAVAYDLVALRFRGAKAKLNFPTADFSCELALLQQLTREQVLMAMRGQPMEQQEDGSWWVGGTGRTSGATSAPLSVDEVSKRPARSSSRRTLATVYSATSAKLRPAPKRSAKRLSPSPPRSYPTSPTSSSTPSGDFVSDPHHPLATIPLPASSHSRSLHKAGRSSRNPLATSRSTPCMKLITCKPTASHGLPTAARPTLSASESVTHIHVQREPPGVTSTRTASPAPQSVFSGSLPTSGARTSATSAPHPHPAALPQSVFSIIRTTQPMHPDPMHPHTMQPNPSHPDPMHPQGPILALPPPRQAPHQAPSPCSSYHLRSASPVDCFTSLCNSLSEPPHANGPPGHPYRPPHTFHPTPHYPYHHHHGHYPPQLHGSCHPSADNHCEQPTPIQQYPVYPPHHPHPYHAHAYPQGMHSAVQYAPMPAPQCTCTCGAAHPPAPVPHPSYTNDSHRWEEYSLLPQQQVTETGYPDPYPPHGSNPPDAQPPAAHPPVTHSPDIQPHNIPTHPPVHDQQQPTLQTAPNTLPYDPQQYQPAYFHHPQPLDPSNPYHQELPSSSHPHTSPAFLHPLPPLPDHHPQAQPLHPHPNPYPNSHACLPGTLQPAPAPHNHPAPQPGFATLPPTLTGSTNSLSSADTYRPVPPLLPQITEPPAPRCPTPAAPAAAPATPTPLPDTNSLPGVCADLDLTSIFLNTGPTGGLPPNAAPVGGGVPAVDSDADDELMQQLLTGALF